MKNHKKDNIIYCTFETLNSSRLKHGIFMRHGGCSPNPWKSLNLSTTVGDSRENVIENRTNILNTLDLSPNSYFDVWQVHSSNVVFTNKPRPRDQSYIKADAIITNSKNVSLLMRFADCVPILLYDPIKNVIAMVHAGWIGTLDLIAYKTVMEMQTIFNCSPQNIMAGIGPSIGIDHYQVGDEVVEKTKTAFSLDWNLLINKRKNGLYLDLWKANEFALKKAGIREIEKSDICTACHTNDWFSHRGEQGRTGRFGAVLSLI